MKTPLLIVGLCLALAACATTGLTSADRLELYRAHAGPAQKDMQFLGTLNGWTELGDSALAVWTKPSEAYLLELTGPCPDLPYAPAIGLTSHMSRVSALFDKVIVRDPSGGPRLPCSIKTIRKLDVKSLRAQEKDMRQAQVQVQEREAPAE